MTTELQQTAAPKTLRERLERHAEVMRAACQEQGLTEVTVETLVAQIKFCAEMTEWK